MSVTREALVQLHPHFADEDIHHPARIEFWAGIAEAGLPASRFSREFRLDYIHAHYVAHQMTIEAHIKTGSVETFAEPGRLRHRRFRTRGALPVDLDTPEQQMKIAGAWNSTKFGHALTAMTVKPKAVTRRGRNG